MAKLRQPTAGAWAGVLIGAASLACGSSAPAPSQSSGSELAANEGAGSSEGGAAETDAGALGDATSTPSTIGCANDPRAQAYTANLTQAGNAGALRFTLVTTAPAPPTVGSGNTWILKLTDGSGNPVVNATFPEVKLWMPDHGHGSTFESLTANSDGTYTVTHLYFFMPGLWQVTFQASVAGDAGDAGAATRDSTTFSFCING